MRAIAGWSGSNDDASHASANTLTMLAAAHTVGVRYSQIEYQVTVNAVGEGAVAQTPGNPYTLTPS